MELAQQNTRPQTGSPAIIAKGATITTGASAVSVAIPDTTQGTPPNRIRLASTAACYARLGTPSEGSAVVNAAGTGYLVNDTITLTGGTYSTPMTVKVVTTQLISSVLDAIGSGYAAADTITLAGGTSTVKAITTVDTSKLVSAAVNAAGTGYLTADTITAAGGTFTTAAEFTTTSTKLISAVGDVAC